MFDETLVSKILPALRLNDKEIQNMMIKIKDPLDFLNFGLYIFIVKYSYHTRANFEGK